MNDRAGYISDWFIPEDALPVNGIVAVSHNLRTVGLYKVRDIGRGSMTLAHGGISFPVGTQLTVNDIQRLLSETPKVLSAKVVRSDSRGMHIVW
ncbi:MAG: hypothetical protein ACLPXB_19705 [Thiobacillaceae bacterium]